MCTCKLVALCPHRLKLLLQGGRMFLFSLNPMCKHTLRSAMSICLTLQRQQQRVCILHDVKEKSMRSQSGFQNGTCACFQVKMHHCAPM